MNRIRVACFGLQGFGNDLLLSLSDKEDVEVLGIYTRETSFPFKYYASETMEAVADRMGVSLHYIPMEGDWDCGSADLAIISSFHRIFKKEHLGGFLHVINIHPSLLPEYRGATPTNWMIKNGEQIVGLTAHMVDEGIDTGSILFQRNVLNPFLNDAQLRKALSFLSRTLVGDIISHYPNYQEIAVKDTESYFSARAEADSIAKLSDFSTIDELVFHIKAFTNYPMPKLDISGRVFVIDYENPEISINIELANNSFDLLGYWQASD